MLYPISTGVKIAELVSCPFFSVEHFSENSINVCHCVKIRNSKELSCPLGQGGRGGVYIYISPLLFTHLFNIYLCLLNANSVPGLENHKIPEMKDILEVIHTTCCNLWDLSGRARSTKM